MHNNYTHGSIRRYRKKMKREHLPKILKCYPDIYVAKYYDYKAVKKGNYFEIYRRRFENTPWYLYSRCVIIDGLLFTNWVGLVAPEDKE